MAQVEPDEWLQENYRAVVADKNRNISWKDVADLADASDDKILSGWARKQAGQERDAAPSKATVQPKTTRKSEK